MSMQPKVTLPTGYEQAQKAAASKRKLAEMMLERGLAGPSNPTSWAQVLGQFAQAWAGKSMQKKADRMDAEVSQQMLEAYKTKRAAMQADAQTMTPQELVNKYGNDPLLQDDVKPYQEAVTAKLKSDQEGFVGPDGIWHVKGNMKPGTYMPKLDDSIVLGLDGKPHLNGMAIAAAMAKQGLGSNGVPVEYPQGTFSGQSSSPSPLGPSPSGTVGGKPYWIITGKAYDNPEGK